MARELAFTARPFSGIEAKEMNLVNRSYSSKEEMMTDVTKIAHCIAKKSPLSVRNTKKTFVFGRDHSVQEGLEQVAQLNAGILFSEDSIEAMTSMIQKKEPSFADS